VIPIGDVVVDASVVVESAAAAATAGVVVAAVDAVLVDDVAAEVVRSVVDESVLCVDCDVDETAPCRHRMAVVASARQEFDSRRTAHDAHALPLLPGETHCVPAPSGWQ
jgi:hypothetical protein